MSEWTLTKLNAGDSILDRYDVSNVLGDTALGTSLIVIDRESHQSYMFKQLSFECDPERAEKIKAAVATFKAVVHKSIAALNEFILDGSTGYISMEYVEGESLEEHLKMRRERAQILGVKAAYGFLAHLCAGLDVLHQTQNAHGALSPKSVLVTSQGRVKLIHPVCAYLAENFLDDDKRNAFFSGEFIAPEVAEKRGAVTRQADVYSLALLFCELLSNKSFKEFGSSPETYIAALPAVSSGVKETLFEAVKVDLSDRLPDIQALKDSLKVAVDAPADNDISSIVVGVADLRSVSASADMPALDASQARKLDLFQGTASSPSLLRRIKKDIWIYSKDGLDYGPFDKEGLLKKLYSDDINEITLILNTTTKEKRHLQDIPEFESEVKAYLPVRDAKHAERAKREKQKSRRTKGAIGGAVVAIAITAAVAILGPMIYLFNLAPPEPLALSEAFPPFEKRFELPKVEEVSLNIDEKQALAFFNPEASAKEREAAFAAWEAEHRKKYAALRNGRKKSAKPGLNGEEDEIQTIVFGVGEDGKELEPLMDWEIEEQIMSPRIVRKLSDCFEKHAGGRRQTVYINFTIQQTGTVRNLSSTAQGELDTCLVSSLSSIKFRQFGGTVKRVKYPLVF